MWLLRPSPVTLPRDSPVCLLSQEKNSGRLCIRLAIPTRSCQEGQDSLIDTVYWSSRYNLGSSEKREEEKGEVRNSRSL
jgi:hypothetical protein